MSTEPTPATAPVEPIVRWIAAVRVDNVTTEWRLIVGKLTGRGKHRCVATVWVNTQEHSATWHTWGSGGCGGQNGVEADVDYRRAVRRAKANAAAAAIEQGFI